MYFTIVWHSRHSLLCLEDIPHCGTCCRTMKWRCGQKSSFKYHIPWYANILYYVPIYTSVACPIHWYFIFSTSHGWVGEGNIAVTFVNMNRKNRELTVEVKNEQENHWSIYVWLFKQSIAKLCIGWGDWSLSTIMSHCPILAIILNSCG